MTKIDQTIFANHEDDADLWQMVDLVSEAIHAKPEILPHLSNTLVTHKLQEHLDLFTDALRVIKESIAVSEQTMHDDMHHAPVVKVETPDPLDVVARVRAAKEAWWSQPEANANKRNKALYDAMSQDFMKETNDGTTGPHQVLDAIHSILAHPDYMLEQGAVDALQDAADSIKQTITARRRRILPGVYMPGGRLGPQLNASAAPRRPPASGGSVGAKGSLSASPPVSVSTSPPASIGSGHTKGRASARPSVSAGSGRVKGSASARPSVSSASARPPASAGSAYARASAGGATRASTRAVTATDTRAKELVAYIYRYGWKRVRHNAAHTERIDPRASLPAYVERAHKDFRNKFKNVDEDAGQHFKDAIRYAMLYPQMILCCDIVADANGENITGIAPQTRLLNTFLFNRPNYKDILTPTGWWRQGGNIEATTKEFLLSAVKESQDRIDIVRFNEAQTEARMQPIRAAKDSDTLVFIDDLETRTVANGDGFQELPTSIGLVRRKKATLAPSSTDIVETDTDQKIKYVEATVRPDRTSAFHQIMSAAVADLDSADKLALFERHVQEAIDDEIFHVLNLPTNRFLSGLLNRLESTWRGSGGLEEGQILQMKVFAARAMCVMLETCIREIAHNMPSKLPTSLDVPTRMHFYDADEECANKFYLQSTVQTRAVNPKDMLLLVLDSVVEEDAELLQCCIREYANLPVELQQAIARQHNVPSDDDNDSADSDDDNDSDDMDDGDDDVPLLTRRRRLRITVSRQGGSIVFSPTIDTIEDKKSTPVELAFDECPWTHRDTFKTAIGQAKAGGLTITKISIKPPVPPLTIQQYKNELATSGLNAVDFYYVNQKPSVPKNVSHHAKEEDRAKYDEFVGIVRDKLHLLPFTLVLSPKEVGELKTRMRDLSDQNKQFLAEMLKQKTHDDFREPYPYLLDYEILLWAKADEIDALTRLGIDIDTGALERSVKDTQTQLRTLPYDLHARLKTLIEEDLPAASVIFHRTGSMDDTVSEALGSVGINPSTDQAAWDEHHIEDAILQLPNWSQQQIDDLPRSTQRVNGLGQMYRGTHLTDELNLKFLLHNAVRRKDTTNPYLARQQLLLMDHATQRVLESIGVNLLNPEASILKRPVIERLPTTDRLSLLALPEVSDLPDHVLTAIRTWATVAPPPGAAKVRSMKNKDGNHEFKAHHKFEKEQLKYNAQKAVESRRIAKQERQKIGGPARRLLSPITEVFIEGRLRQMRRTAFDPELITPAGAPRLAQIRAFLNGLGTDRARIITTYASETLTDISQDGNLMQAYVATVLRVWDTLYARLDAYKHPEQKKFVSDGEVHTMQQLRTTNRAHFADIEVDVMLLAYTRRMVSQLTVYAMGAFANTATHDQQSSLLHMLRFLHFELHVKDSRMKFRQLTRKFRDIEGRNSRGEARPTWNFAFHGQPAAQRSSSRVTNERYLQEMYDAYQSGTDTSMVDERGGQGWETLKKEMLGDMEDHAPDSPFMLEWRNRGLVYYLGWLILEHEEAVFDAIENELIVFYTTEGPKRTRDSHTLDEWTRQGGVVAELIGGKVRGVGQEAQWGYATKFIREIEGYCGTRVTDNTKDYRHGDAAEFDTVTGMMSEQLVTSKKCKIEHIQDWQKSGRIRYAIQWLNDLMWERTQLDATTEEAPLLRGARTKNSGDKTTRREGGGDEGEIYVTFTITEQESQFPRLTDIQARDATVQLLPPKYRSCVEFNNHLIYILVKVLTSSLSQPSDRLLMRFENESDDDEYRAYGGDDLTREEEEYEYDSAEGDFNEDSDPVADAANEYLKYHLPAARRVRANRKRLGAASPKGSNKKPRFIKSDAVRDSSEGSNSDDDASSSSSSDDDEG